MVIHLGRPVRSGLLGKPVGWVKGQLGALGRFGHDWKFRFQKRIETDVKEKKN